MLQLGDSHTAADFFTGRVRERLQQVFGAGGMDYLVPGKPHPGVRSALFDSDASDGWSYEALQKSDETRRFYLSGFNAVARHAGASLSLRARGGLAYDRARGRFSQAAGRRPRRGAGRRRAERARSTSTAPPMQRATLDFQRRRPTARTASTTSRCAR